VVEMRIKAGGGSSTALRMTAFCLPVRLASRPAPLRMTGCGALILLAMIVGPRVSATTYYVSSNTGSDANSGTSAGAAWQTVAKVNEQTFSAGDAILFTRGDVWNESLTPPASGASGNPFTFDAYRAGRRRT
jgi:hypothetical protein